MPAILINLVTLRGLSEWDSRVMAPLVSRLHRLQPSESVDELRLLIHELQEQVVDRACGGIESRARLFRKLLEVIDDALVLLFEESHAVRKIIDSCTCS